LSRQWRPADPDSLPDLLAGYLHDVRAPGRALRVAIDGPLCAHPAQFSASLVEPLRSRGLDAVVISADTFWRDASLRLEFGRQDALSYRTWLDAAALKREVLDPVGPGGSGQYLPSLRDPVSNRSSREPFRTVAPATVLIVAGEFLLDGALPFDVTVHLALSAAARERCTPAEDRWTLVAHEDYNRDVAPVERADVVVKLDDPRHPAVAFGTVSSR
jgi:hypothetical protein